MTMKALFGGTFNPVHRGHLALARHVMQQFSLSTVDFIPSYLSVHRAQPQTPATMRLQMLQLALEPEPGLHVNRCELERGGPSYTVDTLRQIKQSEPVVSLCWLMGADAFNHFADWHRPDEILQLANLIVCSRPAVELQPGRFQSSWLGSDENLQDFSHGRIAVCEMPPSHCASSDIRQQLARGESAADCLPRPVLEFIRDNNLYINE